ncbi:hypothetical protein [Burkholderia diffusa]|uniref:hypothetical protein n=1 Tax=Burkholderia diffusa TaxID=488732 RepID=UPI00158ED78A|nr:hypothetical protein [Burkholderia diffusa]
MDKDEILNELAGRSLQQRQRYASLCLRRYCEAKKISHSSVDRLLSHLDAVETFASLSAWDAEGACLDLNGRGDPIPHELEVSIPKDERLEFRTMVDSVVEVGIVDLYGEKTALPIKFLDKVMQILERNRLPLPRLNAS